MDVKQAVIQAKTYVKDLFEEEKPANIALEEVEYNNQASEWLITVGFNRPWDRPNNLIAEAAGLNEPRRSYKVVRISDETGEVMSMKNFETAH